MLLDSLKPDAQPGLHAQIEHALAEVERELAQYQRVLTGELDPAQRLTLERLHARRSRAAALLQSRLDSLRHARHLDDQDAMWQRTLQVA